MKQLLVCSDAGFQPPESVNPWWLPAEIWQDIEETVTPKHPDAINCWINQEWFAAGWPFRCATAVCVRVLVEKERGTTRLPIEEHGVVRIPWKNGPSLRGYLSGVRGPSDYIELPTAPLWCGLILNTICFGTLLWGAWSMPRALRRARRARRLGRGACLHCGYDLRGAASGSACPECGATFPLDTFDRS